MPDQPPAHDLGELERLRDAIAAGQTANFTPMFSALPTMIEVVHAAMDVDEAHMASMNEAPPSSPLGKLRAALRPFYGSDR